MNEGSVLFARKPFSGWGVGVIPEWRENVSGAIWVRLRGTVVCVSPCRGGVS